MFAFNSFGGGIDDINTVRITSQRITEKTLDMVPGRKTWITEDENKEGANGRE